MITNTIDVAIQGVIATHVAALNRGTRPNALLLRGAPGMGKSEAVDYSIEMLARMINEPVGYVTIMLANCTSVDLMGFMLPIINKDTNVLETVFSTPPWFPTKANLRVFDPSTPSADGLTTGRWFKHKEWQHELPRVGVVFLDEWSQIDEDVQKPGANLLLNGQVGEHQLQPAWRVLAAGNLASHRSGVSRELMHVINRRCGLMVVPSLPAWKAWAYRQPSVNRPHYMTIMYADQYPAIVFNSTVPDEPVEYCTARSLVKMDQDLQALRTNEDIELDRMPTSDLARAWCAGWVGEPTMSSYFTHLRNFGKIPTIHEIVKDPSGTKVPSEKDQQMVVAYMLAHHVSDANAAEIFVYMKRLHREMQTLTVNATINDPARARALAHAPGATQWLIDNKEILLAARS